MPHQYWPKKRVYLTKKPTDLEQAKLLSYVKDSARGKIHRDNIIWSFGACIEALYDLAD
jgi:hypothetical protein